MASLIYACGEFLKKAHDMGNIRRGKAKDRRSAPVSGGEAKGGFQYLFGPVSSWRLGASLGIDLLSQEKKICNFDCLYCQLGETRESPEERRVYVSTEAVLAEMNEMAEDLVIDVLTFSGRGEPTLARNLGETIRAVKEVRREPVAVLTNASLMNREDVREELYCADIVVAKLDACSEAMFRRINRPEPGIRFADIVEGLKRFRFAYRKGKLALQIMFIGENRDCAKEIAGMVERIVPDEVQINTPLRPCRESPLSREEIDRIVSAFGTFPMLSVYEEERPVVRSLTPEGTLRRRGKVH